MDMNYPIDIGTESIASTNDVAVAPYRWILRHHEECW